MNNCKTGPMIIRHKAEHAGEMKTNRVFPTVTVCIPRNITVMAFCAACKGLHINAVFLWHCRWLLPDIGSFSSREQSFKTESHEYASTNNHRICDRCLCTPFLLGCLAQLC